MRIFLRSQPFRRATASARFMPFIRSILFIFGSFLSAENANAQDRGQNVLILSSSSSLLPANVAIQNGFLETLQKGGLADIVIYTEHLDALRFSDPRHEANSVRYLKDRYAGTPLALIVVIGPQALRLVHRYREQIASGVPVVYAAVQDESIPSDLPASQFIGAVSRFDVAKTIELALSLQPQAEHLTVVTGASEFDRTWEARARRELVRLEDRISIRFLAGLPMDAVLREVSAAPDGSFILYLSTVRDGTGRIFTPRDVARVLSAAANRPVYSVYDTYLGEGIVGGFMSTFTETGATVGRLARRIIEGDMPTERIVEVTPKFMADWRALQRWGLDAARLPEGTEIRNRPLSIWQEHQAEVIATATILILQGGLITALLFERVKRRRVTAELLESEVRLAQAAEAGRLGVWQWDIRRDRGWANALWRNLLHIAPRADLQMDALVDAAHPDDRAAVRDAIGKALLNGGAYRVEFRAGLEEADVRWLSAQGRADRNEKGELERVSGVLLDLTERKRSEQDLRASEERYRAVVDTQTEMICRYQPDTTLTFVNDAYCRYFGKSRDLLIGHRWIDLLPESTRPEVMHRIRSLVSDPRSETHEHPVLRPDSTLGWQQWTDTAVIDENGHVLEIQGVGRDLTDLKRAELELRERQRQVTHLSRVSLLGGLSAVIAHEINQPLSAILSNAQAARRLLTHQTPDFNRLAEIVEDVIAEEKRAATVIERLRALLKGEEEQMRPLDLNQTVDEVLALVHGELRGRHIILERLPVAALPPVLGDKIQLQQVLLNLVLNGAEAVSHTRSKDKRIVVSTSLSESQYVEVRVSDRGPGIDPAALGSLFEPFFTTKSDGLGLGLSISRSIIAAHRGQIRAQNNPEGGATFYFSIPSYDGALQ